AFGPALAVGLPLGVAAGPRRGGAFDRLALPLILIGQAMPSFWTGLLLILIVSVRWHLLPSSGSGTPQTLVLPSITLAWLSLATIARMSRSAVLEEARRDYVRTAHAKGVSPRRVVVAHVLRNAAIPILTTLATDVLYGVLDPRIALAGAPS